MKIFIRQTLTFSIIILALITAGEAYVRSMPNPARFKHQWMLSHSQEVETLILGSSHCFYGLNPTAMGPNTFSMALPTQPYRYDWYELTHYPLPRLKNVVLPFSYQSLFEDLESEPRLRYWAVRYRLYMDCDIHSPLSIYGLECLHVASFKEKLSSGTVVKAIITGKGCYSGTAEAVYRIIGKPMNISKVKFKIKPQEYTGYEIHLKESDITSNLVYGEDYKIYSYVNNVKKGTAKVTLVGIGRYGGKKTVTFKITKQNVANHWKESVKTIIESLFDD